MNTKEELQILADGEEECNEGVELKVKTAKVKVKVDYSEKSFKQLQRIAKSKGVSIKGLRSKVKLIKAITKAKK